MSKLKVLHWDVESKQAHRMSKVVLYFLDVALVEAINRPSKRHWWKNKTLRHLLSQKQEMKFVVERPLANIGVFRIAQSVRCEAFMQSYVAAGHLVWLHEPFVGEKYMASF